MDFPWLYVKSPDDFLPRAIFSVAGGDALQVTVEIAPGRCGHWRWAYSMTIAGIVGL